MSSQLPTTHLQEQTTKRTKFITTTFTKQTVAIVFFVSFMVHSTAQQLLDRVVARVGTTAITQTDVDSAIAFGIVQQKTADGREPLKQMIDRRLILDEVSRFPPPEPTADAVNEQLSKMKAAAGDQAAAVMRRTGVDEKRLAEFARETLRIEAYLAQRFGSGARAEQQRAPWLDGLRARGDISEFTTR